MGNFHFSRNRRQREFCTSISKKLIENNIKTWFDENEILLGHSITESINYGLNKSKFAVVVLSKFYFKKGWTNSEINAYFAVDSNKAKRVLPIWHNVSKVQVYEFAPILVDRLCTGITIFVNKYTDLHIS